MQLDRNLAIPLPSGWSSIGGPRVSADGHRLTGGNFVIAGNFSFARTVQLTTGKLPAPPDGKVVVRIVDLPENTATTNWQHVTKLQLPVISTSHRTVTWNVAFETEPVQISVKTGSARVTAPEKALINRFLAKVQHR